MLNRCWPGLRLLALLVVLLTLFPQPAGAQTSAPHGLAYTYDCVVFAGDSVICNGVRLSGDKHFYATRVEPGQTISLTTTVMKLPMMLLTSDTAYLQITSASGSVSGWHQISQFGTVSWTNTTGVAQDLTLIWKSNGLLTNYRAQGSVQVF
jgi:hypothetical protein